MEIFCHESLCTPGGGSVNNCCVIISGGEESSLKNLPGGAFVIACDRGYAYARHAGVRPDAVIGDFDSYAEGAEAARKDGVTLLTLPVRKDDTDTMRAARYALEQGYSEIILTCALGGRLDHLLANLQTAMFLVNAGARARIISDDTEISVFTAGSVKLQRRDGWSLSVFSLSDRCTGVWIRGASYPVEDVTLENTFPLGVSNAWKEAYTEIGVKTGILAVISARYAADEAVHDEPLPEEEERT